MKFLTTQFYLTKSHIFLAFLLCLIFQLGLGSSPLAHGQISMLQVVSLPTDWQESETKNEASSNEAVSRPRASEFRFLRAMVRRAHAFMAAIFTLPRLLIPPKHRISFDGNVFSPSEPDMARTLPLLI